MTLRRMWDAAWPPADPPAWEVAAGYIGGNTPHVWSDAEWAATGTRWRLPIFTRSHDGDPDVDAAQSVRWLQAHKVPAGATLALDYETRVDADYLRRFDLVCEIAGYRVMVYGSRSTIFANPRPSGGYWTAHWTNEPHLCSEAGVAATQYGGDVTIGQPYDANLVADSTPLWDTQQEADMPLDATDLANIRTQCLSAVKAVFGDGKNAPGTSSWAATFVGTYQGVARVEAQVKALGENLSDDEANLLAAIAGIQQGLSDSQADVAAAKIADSLTASLPPAFVAALKDAL